MRSRKEFQDKSAFRKAFAYTTIPIITLSILSLAGNAVEGLYFFWYIASLMWVLAILATIGFALTHRSRSASGILAGVGVGFLALGASCFANIGLILQDI